ncbi:hypothetical protein FACS189413_18020 [Bacteroidia bacterium]|nr:hypothetical protein FACS189463_3580 [Bacteroidia bacterium]GHU73541.1 hypothetical protein FACS189413_18020 [Bacteroidia bacterium]
MDASLPLFKKQVTVRASVSYNTGLLNGEKQNDVVMTRCNASYTLMKKHNFSLAYTFQYRTSVGRPDINHSLLTAGYSYNF